MIPCICKLCQDSLSPHFFEYGLLRRYEGKEIMNIRCDKSLEEVSVLELTSNISKKTFQDEKIVICENKNATLLNLLGIPKVRFFPEEDSSSVYIKILTNRDLYGLRDRDFLTDEEVKRIRKKHPNYFILEYYCFENYLYHPENIKEIVGDKIDLNGYIYEIIKQKNENKYNIISNFKISRKNYQEFKIKADNLNCKGSEMDIIEYINSDDIEIFFKAFSVKMYLNKSILNEYQLTPEVLSSTKWFKSKICNLLDIVMKSK